MSVIDLNNRITEDWDSYNRAKKSVNSLIHVNGDIILENVGPASMNLTVGDRWYDCSKKKFYQIPKSGVKVKPSSSIIIETNQEFAVPYNAFGIVFGTGKNIFKGGFVSTGKINPGFHGALKIGYYNGSNKAICFEPKDLLACCSFFEIETTLERPLEKYLREPEAEFEKETPPKMIINWAKDNWYAIISIIISVMAIVFSVNVL